MGLIDWIRGRSSPPSRDDDERAQKITAASKAMIDADSDTTATYDNRNITFTGDLSSYDYDSILRDKQSNIDSLFELADYYVDKDPIFRGIIRGVYTTFSMSKWKLIGESEKVKQKYEDYYQRINLRDRMASIFYQYYKYGNVYVYLMEDGNLITLPVHKTRIANVMVNGEPVLEFNAQSISTDMFNVGATATKDYLNDDEIDVRLKGFPPEIAEGVKRGDQWVQLNPENTYCLQDLKEDWMRYAIPIIAACLTGLAKKALIENYENALLNLGINSFIHVTYGDEKDDILPDRNELSAVQSVFRKAMKGNALAVTNHLAKANVVQADTKDLFQYDKYKHVNAEILSGGGISGIIVSGRADDGSTFASAQVSISTADKRIELARENFCELMNKINRRINGSFVSRSSSDKVPRFTLIPIDLSGNSKFQKACSDLWKDGCLSTESLLQAYNMDFSQEVERKKKELSDGTYELLKNDSSEKEGNSDLEGKIGRPEIPDEERTSDKGKAATGKAPKPSNPEGSMGD